MNEAQVIDDIGSEPLPDMSDYPYTVTSEAQLIALLLEAVKGIGDPAHMHIVTDETWEQRKAEVRRHAASRQINLGQTVV